MSINRCSDQKAFNPRLEKRGACILETVLVYGGQITLSTQHSYPVPHRRSTRVSLETITGPYPSQMAAAWYSRSATREFHAAIDLLPPVPVRAGLMKLIWPVSNVYFI